MNVLRSALDGADWRREADTARLWGPYSGVLRSTLPPESPQVVEAARAVLESSRSIATYEAYFSASLAQYLVSSSPTEARTLAEAASRKLEAVAHAHDRSNVIANLAQVALALGDVERAKGLAGRASEIAEGKPIAEISAAATEALVSVTLGEESPQPVLKALELAYSRGQWSFFWRGLSTLAVWLVDRGALRDAAIVFGHLEQLATVPSQSSHARSPSRSSSSNKSRALRPGCRPALVSIGKTWLKLSYPQCVLFLRRIFNVRSWG